MIDAVEDVGFGYPTILPNVCPSLEDLHIALVVLHHHPDKMEKRGASTWLSDVQSSTHAWGLSVALLQENRDIESAFFGAQTIRMKIQTSFHELSAEQRILIRNRLLSYLKAVNAESNDVVVKRLCLALADLAFKMPSWPNPIEDIISEFCSLNIVPLMDILKAIPEEALTSAAPARNVEVKEYLQSSSGTISSLLDNVLTRFQTHPNIDVPALRCLMSWIPVHPLRSLLETSACDYAFRMMTESVVHDETHEAASMFVSALLECLRGSTILPQIGVSLLKKVKQFQLPYHLAVAHEDHHKVLRYSKIFTELAECYLPEIIEASVQGQAHYSVEVFDFLLECVGHHDYEVAERTFYFWFLLGEEVMGQSGRTPSILPTFRPYIERLIISLCNNCQMEPDQAGLLEQGDEFQDFRSRTFELVQEVALIIGTKSCFMQLLEELHPGGPWEASESILFVMSALGTKIETLEEPLMKDLFTVLQNNMDNESHVAIRHTVANMMGKLAHLITVHPHYLAAALNWLIKLLTDPLLAPQAALSVAAVCTLSPQCISVHFNMLMPLNAFLDSYPIPSNVSMDLLVSLTTVLEGLESPNVESTMRHLCWPHVAKLKITMDQNPPLLVGSSTDPVISFDRLTAIFNGALSSGYLDTRHPFLPLFKEFVFPVLLGTFHRYKADERIIRKCTKTLRFALRAMGKKATELLYLTQYMIAQVSVDHGCLYRCLYKLAFTLMEQFMDSPECSEDLHKLLQTMTKPTFERLQYGAVFFIPEAFAVVERFFRRSPTMFLQRTFTEQIVQGSIFMLMQTRLDTSLKSHSLRFFTLIVTAAMSNQAAADYPLRRQLVTQLLEKYSKTILVALWCAVLEGPTIVPEVSAFLMQLRAFNVLLMTRSVNAAVLELPSLFTGDPRHAPPSEALLYCLYGEVVRVANMEEMAILLDRIAHAFIHKTRVQMPMFN